MGFGKYKFQLAKKGQEAKRNRTTIQVKEMNAV
jgi:translation initiation factor IF-3